MVRGWGSLDWNRAAAPGQAIAVSSLIQEIDKVAACSHSAAHVEEVWRCVGSQIHACAPRVNLHTSRKDTGLCGHPIWSDRWGTSVITLIKLSAALSPARCLA